MKSVIFIIIAFCVALSAGSASARGGGGGHGGGVHFSFGLPLFFGYPSYYYEPYYPRYYYPPPQYYYPSPPVVYDDPLPPRQSAAAPEIRLDRAPEFIYSQELGFFVSMDIPYDMTYDGNNYYLFYGGYWYRGRNYTGPWELVTVSNLPARLLKQRIEQIRYQRDLEVRRYETSGEKYDGQFHRP
jgi:hypothetical protein